MPEKRPARDPVMVYDPMREAANRLVAVYASQVTVGGIEDPAVRAIADLMDEVERVDPHYIKSQDVATESFRSRAPALHVSGV